MDEMGRSRCKRTVVVAYLVKMIVGTEVTFVLIVFVTVLVAVT